MALHQTCSDNKMERWRQLHDKSRPQIMSTPGLAVPLISRSAGFSSSVPLLVLTDALGMALTQYGWVLAVSPPALGTRDAAALRWGRSRATCWSRGSAFWPETSARRAGQTKPLSPRELCPLNTFKADCHNRVRCLSPLWLLCFISYHRQLWWCLTEWRLQWGKYIILHGHSWKHVTAQFVVQRRGIHVSDYQIWHSFNHVKFEGLNSPEFNSWPDNQDIFSFNTSLKHKLMNKLWVRCSVLHAPLF